jgi:hypothetical protein
MSNLYSDRAQSLHEHAQSLMEAFLQLYDNSKSTDAQLVATSVVYAGELIAAAMYEALAKEAHSAS